jgi:Protein of unknown function (DUF2946)
MTHRPRHRLIWLALLAMLAVALLPTVSHALAHARGGVVAWAVVCTPQGLRGVTVASATPDPDVAPTTVSLEHCPLCTLAADQPGLPSAFGPADLRRPFDAARQPPSASAPCARPAWPQAQPRGPPGAA